eukprot:GFKZ01004970.1.p1 GENE.GFKZ01004970.1~~GFKZ01004970.1.p1  ORF type:complete len:243 (+),score=23.65 GFKZ01004970.1:173-901(+)
MITHNLPPFLLLLLITLTTASNPRRCPRTLSTFAEASISTVPDIAGISAGIITVAETAEAALNQNNRRSRGILNTLSEFGIAARDVRSSFFNIEPRFRNDIGPFDPDRLPVIIGYRVTNNFNVLVRNLTNLGSVLDGLVRSGSNSVSTVSFSIEDSQEIRSQSKALAVANARTQAMAIAEGAGLRLGRLLTIQESGAFVNTGVNVLESAPSSEVPISLGELEVRASATVEFELLGTMEELDN